MASSGLVTFARRAAVAAVGCALLCLGGGPADAQGIGSTSSFSGAPGAAPSFSKEQLDRSLRSQRRPPAALPGAAGKEAIAPPTKVPTLMSPTEELFDAINRGDMATVRDALSRGADLSAPNELGLTPLDLSIDLGRNDISFLLLSMREGSSTKTGPALASAANPLLPGSGKSAPRVAARERPARNATRVADAQPAGQPSLPVLFANNGGEPIPSAGFLGFGGR